MIRFLIICLLLPLLSGCDGGCPPEYDTELFYVNNSEVNVNLIVVKEWESIDSSYYRFERTTYKQEIKNNDTLCNYYLRRRSCSRGDTWEIRPYELPFTSRPLYYKIEFLGEPKTCLVFNGDKTDNDIRYWENYILAEEDKKEYLHIYHYYITPEHKAMAKEEDCQGSASD